MGLPIGSWCITETSPRQTHTILTCLVQRDHLHIWTLHDFWSVHWSTVILYTGKTTWLQKFTRQNLFWGSNQNKRKWYTDGRSGSGWGQMLTRFGALRLIPASLYSFNDDWVSIKKVVSHNCVLWWPTSFCILQGLVIYTGATWFKLRRSA